MVYTVVPQQVLNVADVCACLQQVDSIGVAQHMDATLLSTVVSVSHQRL